MVLCSNPIIYMYDTKDKNKKHSKSQRHYTGI